MNIMDLIFKKAKSNIQKVAFCEVTELKTLNVARTGYDRNIFIPYLVGNKEQIQNISSENNISLDNIKIIDTSDESVIENVVQTYMKNCESLLSEKSLKRKSKDSMYVAFMMQAYGEVDVTFAGLTHTTGDVILTGQTIVGLNEGCSLVSSVALFDIPEYEGSEGNLLAFGDSAVCVNPTSEELADISISACDTISDLLNWHPRCALLSYSTCGSGEGELVDKVVEAVKIANEKRPDLDIDGEFQLDSALNINVAKKKVKKISNVAGQANIIIWPDLNAGNIGVKLVQTFAHANAYGPMLQGFKKIVCDCSRGASVEDMLGNLAFSCIRAHAIKEKKV